MFTIDLYLPTRIVFGPGRLNELRNMKLPGKRALICVTADGLMTALGILPKVQEMLQENGVYSVVFDRVEPNPTLGCVNAAVKLAKEHACDFVIGLGGGSSIDTAKAAAILLRAGGGLWDYAYTGTGGRKEVTEALPVVTISTTCGTGTECDQYCVITNEETNEKLDFTAEAIFPAISIIDPELMLSLPKKLTVFQGLDALFHCAECYVCNGHQNRMLDLYAGEGVRTVAENLTCVVREPDNIEARTNLAYAADILGGYSMSLVSVTSHHILAQTLGGMYPTFPHGATLIAVAESYYTKACRLLPNEFDELGELMGEKRDAQKPGYAFVRGLIRLFEENGVRELKMSEYGVQKEEFEKIVAMTVDVVGVELDRYTLTKQDFMEILENSYR